MMKDYPAAHSMDTDWFAVDADGNVGIFHSSEDGAVPRIWKDSIDLDDFISQLPKNERGITQFSVDSSSIIQQIDLDLLWEDIRLSEQVAAHSNEIFGEDKWKATTYELLLRLSSVDVIDELLPDVWGQFAGPEVVVYVERCPTAKLRQLIESGKVLGGYPDLCPFENSHLFGLFPFRHDFGAPAPYKRRNVPDNPLKMDMLSPEIQQIIQRVHLDKINFTETPEIQPIEHMECRTWRSDDWWLDTKRERAEWQEVGNAYDELDEEEEQE